MNLLEFSDKWIEENVSDFYPQMKNYVRAFVSLCICQRHPGSSSQMFLSYIFKLFDDYDKYCEEQP